MSFSVPSSITASYPLSVANGGTNSNVALSGSSIMVSDGGSVIQGQKGTSTTVLHGNASGQPTYSAVNLATDVTGLLPSANISNTLSGKILDSATNLQNPSISSIGDVFGGGSSLFVQSGGKFLNRDISTSVNCIKANEGGTGQTTYTNGQLLIGNASNGLSKATLTAGSNISITNGDGAITIDATGGAPGNSDRTIQYNNSSSFGGSGRNFIDFDDLQYLTPQNTIPTPSASGLKLYDYNLGGREMLSCIGSAGYAHSLQPFLGSNKVFMASAVGNGTVLNVFGANAGTATGATARNVATTNLFTSTRRIGYVSSATAGTSAGVVFGALQFWRGNASRLGGFMCVARWGPSSASTVSTQRSFVGFTSSASAIGNVEPTTLTNIIGFGNDSSDSNIHIITADASIGSTLKSNMGASFPAKSLSTDFYETRLFCHPNDTVIYYSIWNITTNTYASGSLNTELPASNQLLAFQAWTNNGSTASAVGIDVSSVYIETNY